MPFEIHNMHLHKVWSTLIAALKDVKQLTAIVEEIEQDIKCIYLT